MGDLSETFWITFTTMGFAFLSGALAYALKSKCSRVKCCCLEIIRDIDAEMEEGAVTMPETTPIPETIPVPRIAAVRRASLRNEIRVAEIMGRHHSVHALNQPSSPITRTNTN